VWFLLFPLVDGLVVLQDIFIDGNAFSDSHSVSKETLAPDVVYGFKFNLQ